MDLTLTGYITSTLVSQYHNHFTFYYFRDEAVEVFLRAPELAVICFTVKDSQTIGASRFIGSYSLPVNHISPGKNVKIRKFLNPKRWA